MLTVHELESVSELPLEDALLIKTYQRAIAGSRRAGKKIVKMILEREKLRSKSRAPRSSRIASKIERVDPENALEALEILGIAQGRRTRTQVIPPCGGQRFESPQLPPGSPVSDPET